MIIELKNKKFIHITNQIKMFIRKIISNQKMKSIKNMLKVLMIMKT